MKAGNLLSGRRNKRLVQRRHRPQISHDGIKVVRCQRCVILIAHRRLELAAVLADAGRNCALDFVIGPGTDTLGLARGDIARHGDAPWAVEFEAAGAQSGVPAAYTLLHRRVALHAMGYGDEIESLLEL